MVATGLGMQPMGVVMGTGSIRHQAGDELPMQWIWGFPEPTRRLKLIHTEGAVAKIKWVMN
jgi:hypothetical protein